jgi:predicted secreted protein
MATAGKLFVVEVSVDNAAWSRVAEINDASFSIEGDNQDISAFGDAFVRRIQGIKDTSFSMSGFTNEDDLNGQRRMKLALINDTPIYCRMLYDGVNGMSQEVKVASYECSASVDGVSEVSFDLEGTGPVTLVPAV